MVVFFSVFMCACACVSVHCRWLWYYFLLLTFHIVVDLFSIGCRCRCFGRTGIYQNLQIIWISCQWWNAFYSPFPVCECVCVCWASWFFSISFTCATMLHKHIHIHRASIYFHIYKYLQVFSFPLEDSLLAWLFSSSPSSFSLVVLLLPFLLIFLTLLHTVQLCVKNFGGSPSTCPGPFAQICSHLVLTVFDQRLLGCCRHSFLSNDRHRAPLWVFV